MSINEGSDEFWLKMADFYTECLRSMTGSDLINWTRLLVEKNIEHHDFKFQFTRLLGNRSKLKRIIDDHDITVQLMGLLYQSHPEFIEVN